MNIDDLTLGELKQLKNMFKGECETKPRDMMADFIGKKVIVRDDQAGVFCTTLVDIDGMKWRGGVSRKIHYWDKAGAVEGISKTSIDLSSSRITVKNDHSHGYQLVQMCLCEDDVFESIMGATEWNPK